MEWHLDSSLIQSYLQGCIHTIIDTSRIHIRFNPPPHAEYHCRVAHIDIQGFNGFILQDTIQLTYCLNDYLASSFNVHPVTNSYINLNSVTRIWISVIDYLAFRYDRIWHDHQAVIPGTNPRGPCADLNDIPPSSKLRNLNPVTNQKWLIKQNQ